MNQNIESSTTKTSEIDLHQAFDVIQIGPNKFRGKSPLTKPHVLNRGAYGGNLVAQAILVAIKTSPAGFKPHSLHSYFVKGVNDITPLDWEVEEISNGRSFVNRIVKGIQNDIVVYIANISLTNRNSHREAVKNGESPFQFQTPEDSYIQKARIQDLPVDDTNEKIFLHIKTFPEVKRSTTIEPTRKLSYLVKWGLPKPGSTDVQELQPLEDPIYQFLGLSSISDWISLEYLINHIGIDSSQLPRHTVSLDHSIYYHDDDFDATKWMAYSMKLVRIGLGRVLVEGEIYNDKGVHVASVVQERLYLINGRQKKSKL
ncbi:uncharacterized protein J8A68_000496 [[Candida] subhashii]|uniref:Acyl-CoA thioesterase II n=1 Tax=[Candida] subhashii TaxID=561895 RepID=A0A8J5QT40_9ASCO|nr:uncharacterized protein J8A68_000496 [[Candida] subhashii]KAG7665873.1 hypothetical protein J8A68_000496 [[Candida] subhashii]